MESFMLLSYRHILYLAGNRHITYKFNFHQFFIFVINSLKDVEFLYSDGNLAKRNGTL